MKVTIEAAQDFRALISNFSDQEMQEFLSETLEQNNASQIRIEKKVRVFSDKSIRAVYSLVLEFGSPR